MLREYVSRPSKVLACRISEEGALSKLMKDGKETGKYRYTEKNRGLALQLDFTSDEEPKVGDFIIQESKTKVYLRKAELFQKEYSVQGMQIR